MLDYEYKSTKSPKNVTTEDKVLTLKYFSKGNYLLKIQLQKYIKTIFINSWS